MDEKEYLLYAWADEDLTFHSRLFVRSRTWVEGQLDPSDDEISAALQRHPIALLSGKYRLVPADSYIDLTVPDPTIELHRDRD